eukprot:scaffold2751_cov154-Chaetoceros_neogracile.AAC.2
MDDKKGSNHNMDIEKDIVSASLQIDEEISPRMVAESKGTHSYVGHYHHQVLATTNETSFKLKDVIESNCGTDAGISLDMDNVKSKILRRLIGQDEYDQRRRNQYRNAKNCVNSFSKVDILIHDLNGRDLEVDEAICFTDRLEANHRQWL